MLLALIAPDECICTDIAILRMMRQVESAASGSLAVLLPNLKKSEFLLTNVVNDAIFALTRVVNALWFRRI